MTALIDRDLIEALLVSIPEATVPALHAAAREDLHRCAQDFLSSRARGDDAAARRARHAMTGVIGAFGAGQLAETVARVAEGKAEAEHLIASIEQTLDALACALGLPKGSS